MEAAWFTFEPFFILVWKKIANCFRNIWSLNFEVEQKKCLPMLVRQEKPFIDAFTYPTIYTLLSWTNNTLVHVSFLQKYEAMLGVKYDIYYCQSL